MIIITKQETGTYFLSIEILSGPNKDYLYLTLTLHNFNSPKNLHSSNIPRCVSSLFAKLRARNFRSSSWGFLLTNYCFQLALNTCESNCIYFILKQTFSWYENFAVSLLTFKNSELKLSKISESNIKILEFFWYNYSCHKLQLHWTLNTHKKNYYYFFKKQEIYAAWNFCGFIVDVRNK